MRAIVLAGALAAIAVRVSASQDSTANHAITAKIADLPVRFEANIGQADATVRFLSHGRNADFFLTPSEVFLAFHQGGKAGQSNPPSLLQLSLSSANPNVRIKGLDPLVGKANYFLGSEPSRWRVHAQTFARVEYEDVYPGVDLIFYGSAQQLEYDLVVQPGAFPEVIRLEFAGVEKIEIAANGDLLLRLPGKGVCQRKPVIYQEINGLRKPIAGHYVLLTGSRAGFQVGEYDTAKPLIIDPVLSYSETFGDAGGTVATSIAVDAQGNSYVTGNIESPGFSTLGSFQTNLNGSQNAFVTKFDTNGAVVYSTYLGGSASDYGQGIAVDTNGDAFVTGFTSSTNFPTAHALQSTNGGQYNIFISELNPTGDALIYSTYLGGSGMDAANSIALDTNGNAIITGYTTSTNFPLTNAAQNAFGGESDAFVTKLNTNGSALVYSTYLGGSQTENVGAFYTDPIGSVAVDLTGNAYVTGVTYSSDFPVTNAFQASKSNVYNTVFVAMYTPAGALVHSSYLGGSTWETGNAIAVDLNGDVYVGGSTASYDFPIKNALQTNYAGDGSLFIGDGFLTVFDPTGTNLIYSTFLGGSGDDQVSGIALDIAGNVALTGFTSSPDFPLLNPIQSAGNQGFFVSSNGVWSASNSGLTSGNRHTYLGYFDNYNGNVVALLVDPSNTSILYLSADPGGVFKSFDGGSNWTAMPLGTVPGLIFDPQNPSTLYAWSYSGVFTTTNGATNWTSISTGLPGSGEPFVQTVAVDPNTPTTLYAGTETYGLYKSRDGGNSWNAMPGLTNNDVLVLLVDPQNPSILYAGCDNLFNLSLFQSTDYGTYWTVLGAGSLPAGPVSALAFDPGNSAVVYAIIQGFESSTLNMSADGGASWTNLLETLDFTLTAVAIDPLSPTTIYLGTDQNSGLGVLQSTDGGLTWPSYGLTSDLINTLAINPSNDAIVYAGVNGGQDAFISTVDTNGALYFSTYLGGTGADAGNGIALDQRQTAHMAGFADSIDFPIVASPDAATAMNPEKLSKTPKKPHKVAVAAVAEAVPCPDLYIILYGNPSIRFAKGSYFPLNSTFDTDVELWEQSQSELAFAGLPDSIAIESSLPPGLSLSDGAITGTAKTSGKYTFTITATKGKCVYTATFVFIILPPPGVPVVNSVAQTGGPLPQPASMTFTGNNGPANGTFNVLTTTDLAQALSNWTIVSTGAYDASGNFSVTIPIVSGASPAYFVLENK
jgi:hypothetical protein